MAHSLTGVPVPRKEGRDKVTGKARYVDDLRLEGMIYGNTVRSAGQFNVETASLRLPKGGTVSKVEPLRRHVARKFGKLTHNRAR